MLAHSFKTAADLDLNEPQRQALMKTLVLLETGKLVHLKKYEIEFDSRLPNKSNIRFNMAIWAESTDCGTVCCIGGTAELLGGGGVDFSSQLLNSPIFRLFYPNYSKKDMSNLSNLSNLSNPYDITTEQAARALRSYLTTGEANWERIL